MKDFFTTFEVGELCQVYHTTVINWIKKKQLRAYTTPGKHRRIQRNDLLEFMQRFNIHIPDELQGSAHRRVLVVDDDIAVLALMRKAFSRYPEIDLKTTTNGIEALVMVGKEVPHLIILDVVMPKMDGVEVCRTLKLNAQTADIKIIAITGHELLDNQDDFLRTNVDAIFQKPFSPALLIEKTCHLLGLEEKHATLT